MRTITIALFLATTSLTPALAADIAALSRIDAVTVFPRGAEVTRIAEARIAEGEHTLVFEGLPAELAPETLRVEGAGGSKIEIGSVDSKLVFATDNSRGEDRKRIEKDIEALNDERAALDQAIADADYQKDLIQQMASITLTDRPKEGETRILDAQSLGGVLDLIGTKLASLGKTVLDARLRQREIDRLTGDLNKKLASLAPQEEQRLKVSVHLTAAQETEGTFRLRYRIHNAGWQPIYDARLGAMDKDGKAPIELVRRADVAQSTAESWDNVALTLSTARPIGATAAPDLMPMAINGFIEGRRENFTARGTGNAGGELAAPQQMQDKRSDDDGVADVAPIVQAQANVAIAGFQALYGIGGRVTVDNTGTAKKVRIATDRIQAKLSALAAPKLDPNAYLTAAFTLSGETPLLPGPVMLYRDGVFMGEGALPMLSPGEEGRLGFGADDLVKVKRIEVKRRTAEEGLISTSNIDERAFDITVKNLHQAEIPITILDQMPYSTEGKITVDTLSGMTPPTVRDYERRRGVLAWTFELAPQDTKVLRHGYKVSWPRDLKLGLNEE
ncbi:mucoidy inhibitor MuiA family protein [Taklimakanibacter deserti]|uniref:mucoidy inhibitor MuiA family protein n=1 Tax=Taklimakanibacter deserti TaxID=2267839 RepID=UPI000E657550